MGIMQKVRALFNKKKKLEAAVTTPGESAVASSEAVFTPTANNWGVPCESVGKGKYTGGSTIHIPRKKR